MKEGRAECLFCLFVWKLGVLGLRVWEQMASATEWYLDNCDKNGFVCELITVNDNGKSELTKNSNGLWSFYTEDNNWFDKLRAEVLAPKQCVPQDPDTDLYYFRYKSGGGGEELKLMAVLGTLAAMFGLIYTAFQSKSVSFFNWYRLFALYFFNTTLFIIFSGTGPSNPGFARWYGYAVAIHNFAELYILRHVWWGHLSNALCGTAVQIMYLWIMLTLISFMPIDYLYVLAMVQGATMVCVLLYVCVCVV